MAVDAKTGQPIFGRYSVGLQNVGSYQSSGWPFITGSGIKTATEHKISFPMVTKAVTIIASGSDGGALTAGDIIRVHFQSTGSQSPDTVNGHHYITLDSDEEAMTFNVKCKEIYISADGGTKMGYEIFAELTNIPASAMFALTGAGVTDAGTNPRSDR